MGRLDDSGKVIDLTVYRAMRAAKARGRTPVRYVLWYPGVGCFRPQPRTAALTSAIRPA